MSFPEIRHIPFPLDATGLVVQAASGDSFDARQLSEKGYDFTRGGAAGFTATLEGSVTGDQWTLIANLNASGQGAIPVQFNYLRVTGTVAGNLAGSTLKAAGKVL